MNSQGKPDFKHRAQGQRPVQRVFFLPKRQCFPSTRSRHPSTHLHVQPSQQQLPIHPHTHTSTPFCIQHVHTGASVDFMRETNNLLFAAIARPANPRAFLLLATSFGRRTPHVAPSTVAIAVAIAIAILFGASRPDVTTTTTTTTMHIRISDRSSGRIQAGDPSRSIG